MNNALPKRKNIRLREYDYSSPGWYYVTICAQDHRCLFGEIREDKIELNQYGEVVEEIVNQLPNRYSNIDLDIYQIMPNHIHMIIVINNNVANNTTVGAGFSRPISAGFSRPKVPLGQIVAWFKYQSTKQINHIIYGSGKTTNNGSENPTRNGSENPTPTDKKYPFKKIWQRNYYDHVIRNETDLDKIRHYIKTNPEKWSEDRYYSGKNSRG